MAQIPQILPSKRQLGILEFYFCAMTDLELTDYILEAICIATKSGGMLIINEAVNQLNQPITDAQIKDVVDVIEAHGYAVFQVGRNGYRAQIQPAGITFVENNSFSSPGTPIGSL